MFHKDEREEVKMAATQARVEALGEARKSSPREPDVVLVPGLFSQKTLTPCGGASKPSHRSNKTTFSYSAPRIGERINLTFRMRHV